jgi:hypothetical protein
MYLIDGYSLTEGEKYFVQAGGSIPYFSNRQPSELKTAKLATFETNILEFIVSNVNTRKRAIQTPSATLVACKNKNLEAAITKGITIALGQLGQTIDYIENGKDRALMLAYFKSDDATTRKKVSERFKAISKHLGSNTGPVTTGCVGSERDQGYCKKFNALAITEPTTGRTSICADHIAYPLQAKRCYDGNLAGTLVHELTHSSLVYRPSTGDFAQSPKQCKALSAAMALNNANTYNLVLQSIALGKIC